MIPSLLGSLLLSAVLLIELTSASAAYAQTSPSAYTSAVRYDALGRTTGTIAPDPDGTGALKYLATRTTYDARGLPVKVRTGELAAWQSEAVAPANWSGFTVLSIAETSYDANRRKIKTLTKGLDGVIVSVTQYSYDTRGRPLCTAQRMNPASFTNPPASACTLGAQGSDGPDRITKNIYDAASQLLQMRRAVGTPLEQAEVTYSYTLNGQKQHIIDANGNKAQIVYDGHDRQIRWSFPSKTGPSAYNDATPASALATSGAVSATDYEQYSYDANGNRTSLRKRDGLILNYAYDNLNRMTVKTVPAKAGVAVIHTRNVHYQYDLRGLQTKARFGSLTGPGVDNAYDGFGRMVSSTNAMSGTPLTLSYQYDDNGNRTRITHGDGSYFTPHI